MCVFSQDSASPVDKCHFKGRITKSLLLFASPIVTFVPLFLLFQDSLYLVAFTPTSDWSAWSLMTDLNTSNQLITLPLFLHRLPLKQEEENEQQHSVWVIGAQIIGNKHFFSSMSRFCSHWVRQVNFDRHVFCFTTSRGRQRATIKKQPTPVGKFEGFFSLLVWQKREQNRSSRINQKCI